MKNANCSALRKRFGKKGKKVEEKDTMPDQDEMGITGPKGEMPMKFSKIKK